MEIIHMKKPEEMLYEDKNGNAITNFRICNSSKICFCKSNNKIIETYQFTLQIDGKEDIVVYLNQDDLIKYMKSSGCIWRSEANVNYFTIERKVKELYSKSEEEIPVLFEKPGWNVYKNKWYYVCTDCSISKEDIDTHKTTIIRNRNFNYIKSELMEQNKIILSNILNLILDNKELFYPGVTSTVLSLILEQLNSCNLTQTPIIWLSGETGSGKTTLLRDTFFILEKDFGGINLNLSTQSKKEIKENMENNSDCIIAYDDVRKTYSNSSNQRISTTLEEFVRQYSEIIENRILFAVTGEANVLAQQGESFQNRCMEFEVDNVISKYSEVLNNIKQNKIMKTLWKELIRWMAIMRDTTVFPNLKKLYRDWIEEHKIKSNSARGIQMAFAEYASGYVFNEFIKFLNIERKEKDEWFHFTKKNVENGILYREARHYLPVETFKKYLYKFILEGKVSIIKAAYTNYAYQNAKEVDVSKIALPIYNKKERYIGIYFEYGISNKKKQTEAKPFILLDIGRTLQSMNDFLNLEYKNQLNYFNEKKLYKRLAQKKVLYICQKSNNPDGFRYAFEYPAYVESNRQDLRRCWMLAVDEELSNILKNTKEVEGFCFAYKVEDKYISIIKNFLNDPENEKIKNLNYDEYSHDNKKEYYGTDFTDNYNTDDRDNYEDYDNYGDNEQDDDSYNDCKDNDYDNYEQNNNNYYNKKRRSFAKYYTARR